MLLLPRRVPDGAFRPSNLDPALSRKTRDPFNIDVRPQPPSRLSTSRPPSCRTQPALLCPHRWGLRPLRRKSVPGAHPSARRNRPRAARALLNEWITNRACRSTGSVARPRESANELFERESSVPHRYSLATALQLLAMASEEPDISSVGLSLVCVTCRHWHSLPAHFASLYARNPFAQSLNLISMLTLSLF